MSDREGPSGDDDVGLPKATVFKLVQGGFQLSFSHLLRVQADRLWAEMLPEGISCSKEAKDVIVECCLGTSICHPSLHLHSPIHSFHVYVSI